MVLAIVDDLIFRGKLEAAAAQLHAPLTLAANAEGMAPAPAYHRVLIDLNLSSGDPLAMVRALRQAQPATPIIGYCSHVQEDLARQAVAAGCTTVLPRSVFVQQLGELLAEESSGVN